MGEIIMRDEEKERVDEALEGMAILDFIYIIPMFMLFSYLPTYGFWSGLLNVVIIILVAFGLAYLTRTIISLYKKRKIKRLNKQLSRKE